jgi:peptide-methionine (R)-S-oxide reductase
MRLFVAVSLYSLAFLKGRYSFSNLRNISSSWQKKLVRNSLVRTMSSSSLPKDEQGWRTVLTPSQFRVLRQKGTEPSHFSESTPGELEYELKHSVGTKYPKEGVFRCVACNTPLYYAITKFDSGCGWPAFYDGVPNAIKEVPDADGLRVEILCNNCNSHLGHVFKGEGFPTPTNERHCVNGICLKYDSAK